MAPSAPASSTHHSQLSAGIVQCFCKADTACACAWRWTYCIILPKLSGRHQDTGTAKVRPQGIQKVTSTRPYSSKVSGCTKKTLLKPPNTPGRGTAALPRYLTTCAYMFPVNSLGSRYLHVLTGITNLLRSGTSLCCEGKPSCHFALNANAYEVLECLRYRQGYVAYARSRVAVVQSCRDAALI